MHRGKIVSLFDQPVGAVNQLPRQGEAERFGGSEIDNKLAFGGLADLGDGRVSLLQEISALMKGMSVGFRIARSNRHDRLEPILAVRAIGRGYHHGCTENGS
jgi:hypothetical protein